MAETFREPPTWDSIAPALREHMNISRQQFDEIRASMLAREKHAPTVGSAAPDFELKRLSSEGALSEERLRLADLRGRPVALVFGSYT